MKRIRRRLRALLVRGDGISIRWRLAAVSAFLTMAILLIFAAVIGRLVTDRLEHDFDDELRGAASQASFDVQVLTAQGLDVRLNPQSMIGDAAAFRIVTLDGEPVLGTPTEPDLGPPRVELVDQGDLRIASAPVASSTIGIPALYVQYARDTTGLHKTIGRLWLFLAGGVLAGTALATLAGVAIAGRAMRPISALTAAAREITSTRDPSRKLPVPKTDDEVSELARTLDEMLSALDDAKAETQGMVAAQREFVADASHELRTPLTSILANLELLEASLVRSGVADDDERGEMIASALRSSRRMSRLVSDLLLLARADAGREAPHVPCELTAIATAALAEAEPLADAHNLIAELAGPAPIEGNPDELHRMISNLIDNALRHTPAGTSILVSVRVEHGAVVLELTDDGPGLSPELGEQIFERFVHGAGRADVAGSGGTGLGLAIVRAVTIAHGGQVEAGASEAGGARFTVRMPLAEDPGSDADAPFFTPASQGKGQT